MTSTQPALLLMTFLDRLPDDKKKRKWIAITATILCSGVLTIAGIYGIGQYGMALFILTPVYIGISATVLYGYNKAITRKNAFAISQLTLGLFSVALLIFAIEGVICLIMAAPLAIFLTWIGSIIGHSIIEKSPHNSSLLLLITAGLIPSLAFVEKTVNNIPAVTPITTSVLIDADPSVVWKNVIQFPRLEEPDEFLFKTGIAYPIHANIIGNGVGAIRYCNFSTGSFVEPITLWKEDSLLRFDVADCPPPMKELSFWDIDAPHLHDYFVSRQGQFELIKQDNGKTLLKGTTWYYNNLRPVFYWSVWSDYIIHKIHVRVLTHIKTRAEQSKFHVAE